MKLSSNADILPGMLKFQSQFRKLDELDGSLLGIVGSAHRKTFSANHRARLPADLGLMRPAGSIFVNYAVYNFREPHRLEKYVSSSGYEYYEGGIELRSGGVQCDAECWGSMFPQRECTVRANRQPSNDPAIIKPL